MIRIDINRKLGQEFWKESVHTPISYISGVMAVVVQFVVGFRHLDVKFGQMCVFLGFLALIGLIFLDLIHGRPLYPKKFKEIHPNLIIRVLIIFGVIAVIQIIFQVIPLTIREAEYAMAVVFCAPAEELFFRGILLEPFFRMGKNNQDIRITSKKSISYIEIMGIFLSGIFFAIYHTNYYNNPRLIGMVIGGGLWLGFMYYWYRDLTALILSHFLLNIIFIIQTVYMVNL